MAKKKIVAYKNSKKHEEEKETYYDKAMRHIREGDKATKFKGTLMVMHYGIAIHYLLKAYKELEAKQ